MKEFRLDSNIYSSVEFEILFDEFPNRVVQNRISKEFFFCNLINKWCMLIVDSEFNSILEWNKFEKVIPDYMSETAKRIGILEEDDCESIPCRLILKNGQIIDYCILEFSDVYRKYYIDYNEIDSIEFSEYGLKKEHREFSKNVPEFRNSWPFYMETEQGVLISADGLTNFCSLGEIKADSIIKCFDYFNVPSKDWKNRLQMNNWDNKIKRFCLPKRISTTR